jgi:hypothetical protein
LFSENHNFTEFSKYRLQLEHTIRCAMLKYSKFIKWEKCFFLLVVLVHLIPVLSLTFFVTLDGPARVYHSFLILRLLGGNTHATDYMVLNSEPVPYWTAQFILSLMGQFFSGNVAERIIVGLYVVAMPLAFRKLILTVSPFAFWVSYLIFPFIYSFLLYAGFYNFCMGLPVLFYTMYIYLSYRTAPRRAKMFGLPFLILLLYFSHLFVLVIFLLFAAVFLIADTFFTPEGNSRRVKRFLRETSILLLVSLPALVLSFHFLIINTEKQFYSSPLDFKELLGWVLIIRPLITFKMDGEVPFAILIAVILLLLTGSTLYAVLKKKYAVKGNVWIICSLLLLVLYFTLPNNLSTGGFVSMRLLLFFYLFLLIWFTSGYIHPVLKGLSVALVLWVSFYFLKYHRDGGYILSESAKEYYSLAAHIKENSIVLPLEYSDNWLHNNIAAYLGTTRNIFLLDDYDASSPHFPVTWKNNSESPPVMLGKQFGSVPPCVDIDRYEKISGHGPDYITRWRYSPAIQDSCTISMNRQLEKNYTCIFISASGAAELFQKKTEGIP